MSTKRKIEDYKDQKVAIHCSTKEEWDKIVDLLPSDKTVKKIYWQNSVNDGKSDTINIEGCGWSPKKHYEDEGYTIYPASDFLEKEKPFNVGDLVYLEKHYKHETESRDYSIDLPLNSPLEIKSIDFTSNIYNNRQKEWTLWFKGKSLEHPACKFKLWQNTSELQEIKPKVEMLPYPTDKKYFKAVVTKDIHREHISTKGSMPKLIPKGYQTWFIECSYKDRILSKEDIVCPEDNRWGANIPAEYFEIVEDEKHNDIPEKEWVPQVGEYIVYNNTDVLKVTKVEPCKSHRYWISHTPNSFSGGEFGWLPWKHKIKKATLQDIESIVHTLTDEEILEVCKQFYPKGAKFNNCVNNAGIFTCKGNYKFRENKNVSVSIEEINKYIHFGCIYYHGKFAKIISSPTQKEAKSWVQKQEEMLDDAIKQHPLTPTECYSSNEIIIPQIIKAQKTIQKITIESPTELDLKLKTIKPKQIQTIKI